jgi:hypothetical protein
MVPGRGRLAFELKRPVLSAFYFEHDLVRKVCNFSGSCAKPVAAARTLSISHRFVAHILSGRGWFLTDSAWLLRIANDLASSILRTRTAAALWLPE